MWGFLLLVGAAALAWVVLRVWRQARLRRDAAGVAGLMGFTSVDELYDAVALAAQAGITPTQARPHYDFLLQCYGKPATQHAAKLIRERRFNTEFPDLGFEAAMNRLSTRLAD
jgi:hypothetical protein